MELKPLGTWDLDYLQSNVFLGEYDWVEYKGSAWATFDPKNLADFSKYVSAFANYEGGYLILGVAERGPGGGSPSLDEGVDFAFKNGVKSWLEDMLPNLVNPKVNKLNVQTLSLPGSSDSGVVVIHIPGSPDAPHQAKDGLFYSKCGSKNERLSTSKSAT